MQITHLTATAVAYEGLAQDLTHLVQGDEGDPTPPLAPLWAELYLDALDLVRVTVEILSPSPDAMEPTHLAHALESVQETLDLYAAAEAERRDAEALKRLGLIR